MTLKKTIRKILKEEGEGLKERFIKNMKFSTLFALLATVSAADIDQVPLGSEAPISE